MVGGNGNHIRTFLSLRGGIAIHNPNSDPAVPGGAYGTLGLLATADGADRWIISCYHVLCRKRADFPAATIEPVFHPFSVLRLAPVATVAGERANRELDCAAAQLLDPAAAVNEILGIGKIIAAPAEPTLGMRVLKSGAETGVTEGRIVKISANEFEIAPLGYTRNEGEYELSEGGDSGAVWVDSSTHAPVGLHCRGSDRGTAERAFAKPFGDVLQALGLRLIPG